MGLARTVGEETFSASEPVLVTGVHEAGKPTADKHVPSLTAVTCTGLSTHYKPILTTFFLPVHRWGNSHLEMVKGLPFPMIRVFFTHFPKLHLGIQGQCVLKVGSS